MERRGTDAARESGQPDWVGRLVGELRDALSSELASGRLRPPPGYALEGVEARRFRAWVPVVSWQRGDDRVAIIVTPTQPSEPAYRRTARHDVTYFSEDVADDAQDEIYRRDRAMIDAFAAWLLARDGAAARSR